MLPLVCVCEYHGHGFHSTRKKKLAQEIITDQIKKMIRFSGLMFYELEIYGIVDNIG